MKQAKYKGFKLGLIVGSSKEFYLIVSEYGPLSQPLNLNPVATNHSSVSKKTVKSVILCHRISSIFEVILFSKLFIA